MARASYAFPMLVVVWLLACSNTNTSPEKSKPSATNPQLACIDEGGSLHCTHSLKSIEMFKQKAALVHNEHWIKFILPIQGKGCFDDPLFLIAPPPPDPTDPFPEKQTTAGHEKYLPMLYPDCFSHGADEFIFHAQSPNELHYYRGNLMYVEDFSAAGYEVTGWPKDHKDLLVFELPFIDASHEAFQTHAMKTHEILLTILPFADSIAFLPKTGVAGQTQATESWNNIIPVATKSTNGSFDPAFEIYNQGIAYGHIRTMDNPALEKAQEAQTIGYQDILVLAEAPYDIVPIISGVITGQRQGELSHLNLRARARGTVNCYLKDLSELVQYDNQLVRLQCSSDGVTVSPASLEDAEQWWANWRPDPVLVPSVDDNHIALDGLKNIGTNTDTQMTLALKRFGAKAANLAWLYAAVPDEHQVQGFAIPFHYYRQFLTESTGSFDWGNGPETMLLDEAIAAMLSHPNFQSDTVLQAVWLKQLRDAMKIAPVPQDLLTLVASKIQEQFGNTTTMVRFRSSSNAEDSCLFSGAGLYDSTSVCLADDMDEDDLGPSHCDPDQPKERSVERGLRKVWRSLWQFAAHQERDWFGIDHSAVSMAILVNTRSKNEQANIVAFSGNPVLPWDERFLINAQVGENDVVTSEPGVFPEASFVSLSDTGIVEQIERARASSLMKDGEWVLNHATLTTLSQLLWVVDDNLALESSSSHTVMLDTEWKVLEDGRLIIKQMRPNCVPNEWADTLGND